jgi:hypothetical protein
MMSVSGMDDTIKDTTDTTPRPSTDSHLKFDRDASPLDVERQSEDHNLDEFTASTDEKTTHDPNIVDWDVNDPVNPQNWTTRKKITAVGLASMITFLS